MATKKHKLTFDPTRPRGGRQSFQEVHKLLKKKVPPVHPVKIVPIFSPVSDRWGDCELKDGKKPYFMIRILDGLGEDSAIDTLLHEWAHTLCWTEHPFLRDHGPEWGVAFARVYCAFVGEKYA
jgi:hypothetical protein